MPQLDPSSFGSQLFWLMVSFAVLYLVMSRVVLPRIETTLARRDERLADDLAEAETLQTRAEATLAIYEEVLAQARVKALTLAQDMRAEVRAETDTQKAALDAKLAEASAVADVRLQKARQIAMAGIAEAAQEIVADVLEAIGADQADKKNIKAAVTAAHHGNPHV